MIRDPFGDPPLSRQVTGLITLTAGTDGNRSSIGSSTFPWPGGLTQLCQQGLTPGPGAVTRRLVHLSAGAQ
jgi:hypothetical protein